MKWKALLHAVQHALRDAIPLHPFVNLLRINDPSSYFEDELCLVCLDKPPLLSLSHNSIHLVRLDILVQAPPGQARSVLPNPLRVNKGFGALKSNQLT